jgi:hypothetical protein
MTRTRRILGTVLLVLAGLLVPVAVVATWAARTVTDTDAFVDRVTPVVAEPAVQHLVEVQISDKVSTVVIQELAGPRVNEAIDGLEAPDLVKVLLHNLATSAGGWVEDRIDRVAHKVVTAPQFEDAFRGALEGAHSELVGVLEGNTDQTVVSDGRTVSIKVATITNAVREELTASGLDVAQRIPELDATIPIASVDQLEQWRTYYSLVKVLVWLGPLLVVVLAGLGWWLRRDVERTVLWFAGAGALAVIGVTWGARTAVSTAVDGIVDPDAASAAAAIVRTLTASLATNANIALAVLVLAFVVALVSLQVRGRGGWAGVRRSLRGEARPA